MTIALACLILQTSGQPALFEAPIPSASLVSIQAIAPLKNMGAHDRALLRVLAEVLLEDTAEYGKRQIRDVTLGSGGPLRVIVAPDHLRIDLGVAPPDYRIGIGIMADLLQRPSLPSAAVRDAVARLSTGPRSAWDLALNPERLEYRPVRPAEVQALFAEVFKPENVRVIVGGAITPGSAQAWWRRLRERWVKRPVRPYLRDRSKPAETETSRFRVTTLDLRGPSFAGATEDLPARTLAVFAMGAGKGSAVFRGLRTSLGMSYRQEAMLWPTEDGFRVRVLAAVSPSTKPAGGGKAALEALKREIDAWDESSRRRALGMATGVLKRGLPLHPFAFENGPIGSDLSSQVFLSGYWPLKTGLPWNPDTLLSRMGDVTLEQMREAARSSLNGATLRGVAGNPGTK